MAIVSIQEHFHREQLQFDVHPNAILLSHVLCWDFVVDLCNPNRCLQVKSLISVAWSSTEVTCYPKKHNRKVKEWSKRNCDFSFPSPCSATPFLPTHDAAFFFVNTLWTIISQRFLEGAGETVRLSDGSNVPMLLEHMLPLLFPSLSMYFLFLHHPDSQCMLLHLCLLVIKNV